MQLKGLLGHLLEDATVTEEDLRRALCAALACQAVAGPGSAAPAPAPAAPQAATPLDLPGAWAAPDVGLFDASLTCQVQLSGPQNQTVTTAMLLDTGASVTLLNGQLAETLGLPNFGTENVSGVAGSASAYRSQVTLAIAGHVFADQPCVVDPSYTTGPPLLSIAFLAQNGLGVVVLPRARQIVFLPDKEGTDS
jgi:hypothetical protein